jgi:hypothetical protein
MFSCTRTFSRKRTFSSKRTALLSALSSATLAGSLGLAALPAGAATSSPDAGWNICSDDICAQTISVNPTNCSAVVAVTANAPFNGHFELVEDVTPKNTVENSPTRQWSAGDQYQFNGIPFDGGGTNYQATAWRYDGNGGYTDVGQVNFTIDNPSQC